ncbi:MAG: FAD-binding oxidoreductase [Scytonema sp. PMC 1070.18]|nr:FAD-binding oxidoreductase [Scytonema sp. PMC 1070.18]
MIKIKVIDPKKPDQLQDVDLKPENKPNQACFIGRFLNCDLVLDSAEVSRMHGKLSKKNENYYFADLGSRGGSRINGENTQLDRDYPLKPGDMIQIGRFVLMISQIGSEEDKTVLELGQHKGEIGDRNNALEIPKTPSVSPHKYMPLAMMEPTEIKRWFQGELTVRCVSIINETHDVKTFRFVADPPVLFTYKPGQFVTLEVEINGEKVSRSYTISSTPSRPHTLEITVKRIPPSPNSNLSVPKGLVSNWLHDNIRVGSSIKINGPLGNFTCLTNPNQKLLLISAGSGISPMMSMSRWILDTGANCDVVFFHCARTPRDIIFRQELELMSARYSNFHLAVSITRKEPGLSWLSLTGRFDTSMLQIIASDFRDRTIYVCGPRGFMDNVSQILERLGYPMQNYHEESFDYPRKKTPSAVFQQTVVNSKPVDRVPSDLEKHFRPTLVNVSQENVPGLNYPSVSQSAVVFLSSGQTVPCDGEETILDLAESQGVTILNNCRSGVCGTCKKRMLYGEVRVEGNPEGLEESERQQGYILTCISYPMGKVIMDA